MSPSDSYDLFSSPVGYDFRNMTRTQAKQFFAHFVGEIPRRIGVLEREVRRADGFETWAPNDSDVSIVGLWEWLKETAEPRVPTEEERRELEQSIGGPLGTWLAERAIDLTPRTYSYAFDAGIYLGEVLRKRFPEVVWEIGPKPRNGLNYNRPVVATPDGRFVADPVGLVARSLVDHVQGGSPTEMQSDWHDLQERVRKRR